jgi:hypothetical protein
MRRLGPGGGLHLAPQIVLSTTLSISLDPHEGQRKTTPPALNRFSQDRHL